MSEDIIFRIGETTLKEFDLFLKDKKWNCSHCGHSKYLIEEFGSTGRCSVSSMPYVAASPEGKFSITGSGAPSFTVLCANCFSVTKYNAHEVVRTIIEEVGDD